MANSTKYLAYKPSLPLAKADIAWLDLRSGQARKVFDTRLIVVEVIGHILRLAGHVDAHVLQRTFIFVTEDRQYIIGQFLN